MRGVVTILETILDVASATHTAQGVKKKTDILLQDILLRLFRRAACYICGTPSLPSSASSFLLSFAAREEGRYLYSWLIRFNFLHNLRYHSGINCHTKSIVSYTHLMKALRCHHIDINQNLILSSSLYEWKKSVHRRIIRFLVEKWSALFSSPYSTHQDTTAR